MKNKLNLTSKIVISLVFAVMLFAAIATANQAAETPSDRVMDKCHKKCEQTYKNAVKICKQKYKGDLTGTAELQCEGDALTAKTKCESLCSY